MQEELARKRQELKRVEKENVQRTEIGVKEGNPPSSGEDEQNEEKIIENHFAVNMDRWVESLADDTIETTIFPLTAEQGKVLLAMNQNSELQPTEEQVRLFENLKQDLDKSLEALGTKEGYFLKLSSRSPKDVTLSGERFMNAFQEIQEKESEKLESINSIELRANQVMRWLYQAHTEAMHVYSAEEALGLFLQSRRIFWDLTYDLKKPENYSTHIIIRLWDPIPMESEFRVFVHNKKVTGITQYFTQIYFPELVEHKVEIHNELLDFWSKVECKLPSELENYVIDFAWYQRGERRKWIVLEMNPFNISTGAGLFNWEDADDSDILEGISPCQFRVLEAPVAHQVLNKVHPTWIPILSSFSKSQ